MKTIEQIKKTPLSERSVEEEYRLAKHEKRQPRCVYCGEFLTISQTQYDFISWEWDEKSKSYIKNNSGDVDHPFCVRCETKNDEFIDEDLVNF